MSVLSVGQSKNGQLGHESTKECLDPTVIEGLLGKRIIQSVSGESHSLAVSRFGDVYSWGRSKEGQLGIGQGNGGSEKIMFISKPTLVKTLQHERIIKVACGNFHSLALTDMGKLYEWGQLHRLDETQSTLDIQSTNGLIEMPRLSSQRIIEASVSQYLSGEKKAYDANGGTKPKDEDDDREASNSAQSKSRHLGKIIDLNQTIPVQVQGIPEEVVDISGGWAFSAAVTKSGRLYTWGFNEKGQLGLGNRWFHSTPQLVKTLIDVKIVSVTCGRQHICAITDQGEVYSWGLGVFGQLGHGNVKSYLHPKKIQYFTDSNEFIAQVACGSNFTMVRSVGGLLYAFGHGEYGQLGSTEETQHLDVGGRDNHFKYSMPIVVKSLENKKIKNVACGHLHTIVVTDENEVYQWGWGSSGALGLGNKRFQLVPQLITSLSGEEIASITAGEKHTIVVRCSDVTSFAYDYKSLVNEKKYSDLIFKLQEKKVYSHSLFIKSRCSKLYSIVLLSLRFNNNSNNNNINEEKEINENGEEIKIIDLGNSVKYQIFIGFLQYLYTDHLVIAPHLRVELGKYAEKMGIERLSALCKRYTYRLRITEKVPQSEFSKQLIQAVDELTKADISFKIKESDTSSIYAHKFILTQRNLYFKTMFECSFKEKDQMEFIVSGKDENDISKETFKLLLQYIYGNNEEIINDDNAIDILCLADRFMIEDLKYLCEYHLEQMVLSNNETLLKNVPTLMHIDNHEENQKKQPLKKEDILNFDETLTSFDNICILMQVADGFMVKRLKRICMETISQIDFHLFKILNTKNETLKKIRINSPLLIRELDNYARNFGKFQQNSLIELIR
ncbi:hypothetical protein RB653_003156 [Dictyostelium firmibasis]|uniref:BTB domain-containing protein n=1 Tax=Dictyostelium firmibasis TaxID=79012 RepID=A0AAN7TYT3_9MYCE